MLPYASHVPRSRTARRQEQRAPRTRTAPARRPAAAVTQAQDGLRQTVESSWLWQAAFVLYLGRLALIPLAFDQAALDAFVPPKALLARSLSFLLAALLVALLAIHGRRAFSWSPLHVVVLGYGAIALLATAFALDPIVGIFGAPDRMLGLLAIADVLVVYLATANFARVPSHLKWIAAAAAIPAGVALAYTFVQWAGRDPLAWVGDPVGRPFSVLGNPTILNQYLGTLGILAAAASVLAPLGRNARVVLALSAVALLIGASSTAGKALLLGLGAALPALGLSLWLRASDLRSRLMSLGALGLAGVVSAVGLAFTPLGARLGTLTDVSEIVDRGRLVLYEVALQQVRSRPLLGVGPDNYGVAFPAHRPELGAQMLGVAVAETSPHSWIAKVATDVGLIGLGAFLLVLLMAAVLVVRGRRTSLELVVLVAIAAFLGQGAVGINSVATDWMLWAGLGVIAALNARSADHAEGERTPRGRGRGRRPGDARLIIAAVALAAGAIAALLSLPEWQASREAETARRARAAGDVATAVRSGASATDLDPRRPEYWHGLGLAQVAAGSVEQALESFRRAVDLAPYQASYIGSLVRAELTLGLQGHGAMLQRAHAHALEGVERDPHNGESHYTLALAALVLGDARTAARESERGFELSPNSRSESVYDVAMRAYLALGDLENAERWARLGIQWAPPAMDLRLRLIRLLLDQRRVEQAVAELELALEIDPDDPRARELEAEIAANE